jgi:hypothetical protein
MATLRYFWRVRATNIAGTSAWSDVFDFTTIPAKDPCEFAPKFVQSDFLALDEHLVPQHWIIPIRDTGPGYEQLQAQGKIFERVSLAIQRFHCGSFILSASGGERALVTVEFFRDNASAGPITIKAGTIVTTSKGDRRFVTVADVMLTSGGANDLAIQIQAASVASGWQFDVPGPVTALNGEVLPGEIDTVLMLDMDPPYGDPTIAVRQIDDAEGGQAPMLDGLGLDRGLPRANGETDEQYRARIRRLPDTISPDAMKRNILAYLKLFLINPTFDFIETFELRYQTCWDADQIVGRDPNSGEGVFDPNLFVYDDPRPPVPFRNRWLDETEYRGTFIVVIPILALIDIGMAYDDTATTPADLVIPNTLFGHRAVNAYDVTTDLDPAIVQGSYDGFDISAAAANKGLFDLLQSIKPAGVSAIIEREGE